MKKTFLVLVLTQIFGTFAHAYIEPEIPLYRVFKIANNKKIPGGCTVTLDESSDKRYRFTLIQGAKSTSLEAGTEDLAQRTFEGDILKIAAGKKGTTPSIFLSVDFHNKILDISVNEIECK